MGSPRDWMQTVKQTVDRIKAIIGNPDDTGGSETTGTVMGKLNNIQNEQKNAWFYDGYVEYRTIENSFSFTNEEVGTIKTYSYTVPEDMYFLSLGVKVNSNNKGEGTYTLNGISHPFSFGYNDNWEKMYTSGGFLEALKTSVVSAVRMSSPLGVYPVIKKGSTIKIETKFTNLASKTANVEISIKTFSMREAS